LNLLGKKSYQRKDSEGGGGREKEESMEEKHDCKNAEARGRILKFVEKTTV